MNENMKLTFFFLLAMLLLGCNKKDLDPCSGIVCENGTCINGICDCEIGYTGPSCSSEKTPERVILESVTLSNWPESDNGVGWDPLDQADLRFIIRQGDVDYFTSDIAYNYTSSSITFTPNVDLAPGLYSLLLYDYDDFSASDLMGGIIWQSYTAGEGFPNRVDLEAGLSATITLSYQFD